MAFCLLGFFVVEDFFGKVELGEVLFVAHFPRLAHALFVALLGGQVAGIRLRRVALASRVAVPLRAKGGPALLDGEGDGSLKGESGRSGLSADGVEGSLRERQALRSTRRQPVVPNLLRDVFGLVLDDGG